MSDTQTISGPANKYYHQMLNMADDELDPYEYRLLGHYLRVVGEARRPVDETTAETATRTKMSEGQVSKTRQRLADGGWITLTRIPKGRSWSYAVRVVDRMLENVQRYAHRKDNNDGITDSPHESVLPVTDSPHEGSKEKNPVSLANAQDSATPSGDGSDALPPEPEKEKAPPPKKRKRSAAQLKLDEMINAIASSLGLPHEKVTRLQWGEFRKSGKELLDVGATPDEIPALVEWCRKQEWGASFTSVAMAKNYAKFCAERDQQHRRQQRAQEAQSLDLDAIWQAHKNNPMFQPRG